MNVRRCDFTLLKLATLRSVSRRVIFLIVLTLSTVAFAQTSKPDSAASEAPAKEARSVDHIIFKGNTQPPFQAFVGDFKNWALPVSGSEFASAHGELIVSSVDRVAKEDSKKIEWKGRRKRESQFYWGTPEPLDLTELADGYVSMVLKIDKQPKANLHFRMDCGYPCFGQLNLTPIFKKLPTDQWFRLSLPLACFAKSGADLSKIRAPFVLLTTKSFGLTINEVSLVQQTAQNSIIPCGS